MKERASHRSPGGGRRGDLAGVYGAIANFLFCSADLDKACFGEGAKPRTRGACDPQTKPNRIQP